MKFIASFFMFFLVVQNSRAELGIHNCGLYKIKGYVQQTPKESFIQIYRNTKSQVSVLINKDFEPKLWPYIDHPVTAEISVFALQSPYLVKARINKIKRRAPDPIRPEKDGLIEQIKIQDCESKK